MDSQRFRLKVVRIFGVTTLSLVAFGAWFAHANKDGCWLFWHGIATVVALYSAAWIWFAVFLFLKLKGRIIFVGLSLLAGATFWPPHYPNYVAAAESRAVGQLRSMRFELSKNEYPKTLAAQRVSSARIDNAFQFAYLPEYSSGGTIASYMIQATPLNRTCGCVRSFTITDKGDVHYTSESRAANNSDPAL